MEAAAARRLPASPRSSSPAGEAVRGRSRGEYVANRPTGVHTTREARRVIHVSAPRAKDAGGLGHLSDPLNHAGSGDFASVTSTVNGLNTRAGR